MTLTLACFSLLLFSCLPVAKLIGMVKQTSEIELLGEQPTQYAEHPLYYWHKRPFSAAFYSRGHALQLDDPEVLRAITRRSDGVFLAIAHADFDGVRDQIAAHCREQNRTRDRRLLFCGSTHEAVTD